MKATPVHTTGGATAEAVPADTPATLLDIDDSLGRMKDLTEAIHMMASSLDRRQEDAFQAVARTMQELITSTRRTLEEICTRDEEEVTNA